MTAAPAVAQSLADVIEALRPAPSEAGPAPAGTVEPGGRMPRDPTTPDIITDETIGLLQRDGLIARQAEINEGLLLMDRQLRQAQLVRQLMSIYGPEADIEVAPGKFANFADTPEGIRQRIAMNSLQAQLIESDSELEAVRSADAGDDGPFGALSPSDLVALLPVQPQPGEADPDAVEVAEFPTAGLLSDSNLLEIQGANGAYLARISLGSSVLSVEKGDMLPTGQLVAEVTMTTVVLANPDRTRQTLSIEE
ncbi:MAG TPA: hypothetical protein DDY29_13785 [Rhodobacteraceae bacterium]|nr:hypothetical protein [Paracoccaceae bacterium]